MADRIHTVNSLNVLTLLNQSTFMGSSVVFSKVDLFLYKNNNCTLYISHKKIIKLQFTYGYMMKEYNTTAYFKNTRSKSLLMFCQITILINWLPHPPNFNSNFEKSLTKWPVCLKRFDEMARGECSQIDCSVIVFLVIAFTLVLQYKCLLHVVQHRYFRYANLDGFSIFTAFVTLAKILVE